MSVYDWSSTASDNDDADANINWVEGQNANTVNNSARGMMKAVRDFITQIGGAGATGGSSNAYTFTSPTGNELTAYAAGNLIAFKANHTCTGSATLNVDGLGAKTLKKFGSTNLIANDIESGDIVLCSYDGTNFQIISMLGDTNLQALSGLAAAANKLAYFNGSSSMALADFTAYGRSVVATADAAALQTLAALVPGTNVQAQDAQLQALAVLTAAADRLPYFTGSTTASLAVFTSFARSLLDDANAAAARGTLEIPDNTRDITYGTGAPGTLATGKIYLRHD